MADLDIRDFYETREIVSVLDEQLDTIKALNRVDDSSIQLLKSEISEGKHLVMGQLVKLITNGLNGQIGELPAVCTSVTEDRPGQFKYRLTVLTGNLDKSKRHDIVFDKLNLVDNISIYEDFAEIIDSLRASKLGLSSLRELLFALEIRHFFAYNSDDDNFKSFF